MSIGEHLLGEHRIILSKTFLKILP